VRRAVSGHFCTTVNLIVEAYSTIVKMIEIGITISHAIGVTAKIIGMLPRKNAQPIAE
jgi:hypothetical protein